MTDVELVIKIPEEDYIRLRNKDIFGNVTTFKRAVREGTLLPKEHERLITEPTEEEIAKTIGGKNDLADCIREAVKTVFANAPTIIEADKEYKQ